MNKAGEAIVRLLLSLLFVIFVALVVSLILLLQTKRSHSQDVDTNADEENDADDEGITLSEQVLQMPSLDQLIFVQVIWRHGDRAPIRPYLKDINMENKWRFGWGEMTALGMSQQLELGRLLRRNYVERKPPFLRKQYHPKEIYARSTNVNRTLVSALCNMADLEDRPKSMLFKKQMEMIPFGKSVKVILFGNRTNNIWKPAIIQRMFPSGIPGRDFPLKNGWPTQWTPIPVHTIPTQSDNFVSNGPSCSRRKQLQYEAMISAPYQKIQHDNEDFFAFLSNQTGERIDLGNIGFLNDVFLVEHLHNLPQPSWMNNRVREKIMNLSQLSNKFITASSDELIRLQGGIMLKELVDRMDKKLYCLQALIEAQNKSSAKNLTKLSIDPNCSWINPMKYYAYSAHDTTIGAIANTLNDGRFGYMVPRGFQVQYTSSIALELWLGAENENGNREAKIQILYHASPNHKEYVPITKLITGCPEDSDFCSLEAFKKSRKKYIPVEFERECKAK